MKKAHLELIKNALAKGLTISVFDGECWDVKRSSSYKEIKDSIESVEMAEIRLRNAEGDVVGWAQIIDGLEPDETVADCTYNELMCELTGFKYEA